MVSKLTEVLWLPDGLVTRTVKVRSPSGICAGMAAAESVIVPDERSVSMTGVASDKPPMRSSAVQRLASGSPMTSINAPTTRLPSCMFRYPSSAETSGTALTPLAAAGSV